MRIYVCVHGAVHDSQKLSHMRGIGAFHAIINLNQQIDNLIETSMMMMMMLMIMVMVAIVAICKTTQFYAVF